MQKIFYNLKTYKIILNGILFKEIRKFTCFLFLLSKRSKIVKNILNELFSIKSSVFNKKMEKFFKNDRFELF